MRLTIGSSFTLDSTASSSTVTTAALRLDYEFPFVPRLTGNEMRVPGVRIYVEASSEANLKTAIEAIELQFRQCDGKAIIFYNTTGTAIWAPAVTDWPRVAIEHSVDYGDNYAKVTFDLVFTRPEPVAGGAADETGQRGEIEWQLEIGPNGLTGAVATAEFGPTSGNSPMDNAAAWIAKFYTNPPTGLPAFFSTRLRPVHCVPVASQKPNQATLTEDSYDPFAVQVLFREVYSGIASIPSSVTDLVANVSMVNEAPMDVRSGETEGPAILTLSGYFTIITEDPTELLPASVKVARGAMFTKALEVYATIEADFRAVHSRFGLTDLGDPVIDLGMDSGRCTFARAFSTTKVRKWNENTWIENVDRKVFNDDYKGRNIVHKGEGKPKITLVHELEVESLDAPRPYRAPPLTDGWERTNKGQNVTISAKFRGGRLIFTTRGRTTWRYADPVGGGGVSDTQSARSVDMASIGNGVL